MMNSLMSNFDAVMIFFNLVPSAVSVLYKNSQPILDGRYLRECRAKSEDENKSWQKVFEVLSR